MPPRKQRKGDIYSINIRDNQTWNECPICHEIKENKTSTKGLLYQIKVCEKCKKWTNE